MNVLNMVAVLRPDITSSLWLPIGSCDPHTDTTCLLAKINHHKCRTECPNSTRPLFVLNILELPESLQLIHFRSELSLYAPCDSLPHQTKSCPDDL